MNRTSISVVVPAYNVAEYIEDALRSVLKQSVPAYEIIVIDDGSTDSTAAKIATFSRFPRVKTVRTSNQGLGPARNLGRRMASGEYVYFFDSDDLLEPTFVEEVSAAIAKYGRPDLVLFSGLSFMDVPAHGAFLPYYSRAIHGLYPDGRSVIRALFESNSFRPNAWLYVSKRALWDDFRLSFASILHEDEEIIFPLMAHASTALVIKDTLVRHRIREGSIMTSGQSKRNAEGYLATMKSLVRFRKSYPALVADDDDIWMARIGDFALSYSAVTKKLRLDTDYSALLEAVVTIRKPGPTGRIVFSGLPLRVQNLLRRVYRSLRNRSVH